MNERNVSICQMDRHKVENEKLFKRNFPSTSLKPYFDTYPVQTKYTNMNVMDHRKKPSVDIMKTTPYNPYLVFNPGNRKAPWDYFASNIDMESNLRNQFFALQKSDQRYYVPETNSDLYNKPVISGEPVYQSFPNLQKKETFNETNPDRCNLAPNLFMNHTRVNLKK